MAEKRRTLKDYLLNGNVLNKVFVDRHEDSAYKILDIEDRLAGRGYGFAYLHIHYLNKEYKEGEDDIRNLGLGLDDLEAVGVLETAKKIKP